MPSFICQNCKSTVRYRKDDDFCVCKNCSTRYEISYDDYQDTKQSNAYDINESLKATFMPDEEGHIKQAQNNPLGATYINEETETDTSDFNTALDDTFIAENEGNKDAVPHIHAIRLDREETGDGQNDFDEFSSFEPFYRRTPQQDNHTLNDTFIIDEETAAIQKAAREKEEKLKRHSNDSEADKYRYAMRFMNAANTPSAFEQAAALFHDIASYKDAARLEQECLQKAEDAKKDAIYYNSLSRMGIEDVSVYELAMEGFRKIPGWRDADDMAHKCAQKIASLQQESAQRRANKAKQKKKRKILAVVCVSVILLLTASIFAMIKYIIPQSRYKSALTDMQNGNTVSAYETLISLNGYKDSADLAKSIFETYKTEKLKVAEIGDSVYLGKYDQNAPKAGILEDIEWRVLDKKDGAVLVISKNGLDCRTYNDKNAPTDWEHSALRKWLNSEFIDTAFTPEESKRLLTTTLKNDVNPNYPIDIANNTEDKVFCLSISEAEEYFRDNNDRMCSITTYAYEQGAQISEKKYASVGETCCWQLRTSGFDKAFAAFIYFDGEIRYYGNGVYAKIVAVRPAMWIRTD